MAPITPITPITPHLGRRQWLRALLGGALAASLPRPARASDGAPRVMILGDSMIAGALGLFLENGLRRQQGYVVHRFGKSSTGLARPDFFDWHKEAARQIAAFPAPDAVIAMFGGNDVQGLYMGKGEWIRWNEPGWADEYARRLHRFADIVAPEGGRFFWIGMPVMRPEKFHVRVQTINTIVRAELAIRPGGRFIDIWRLLADDRGDYAERLPLSDDPRAKKIRVRAGDGIHLSLAGAERVEAHVREHVIAQLTPADELLAAAEGPLVP
jgi:hypothetical protein